MNPVTRGSLSRPGPRLRVVLAVVAMVAMMGAGRIDLAAAEPIPAGPPYDTADGMANDCTGAGGEAIIIEDGDGNATQYSCTFPGGGGLVCNMVSNQCIALVVEPTSDPFQDNRPDGGVGGDVGNENVDPIPTATSTASGVVLTEESPTVAPGSTMTPEGAAGATATTVPSDTVTRTETASDDAATTPVATTTLTPSKPAGAASLTLVTATCESDFDLFAAGADPTIDCARTADAFPIRLTGAESDSTRTIGEDGPGQVTFAGLAGGTYRMAQLLPEGMSSAFILACTSDLRSFGPSPFIPMAMVGSDGTLGVTVEPDEALECAWYGVPELGPGLTVQVYACGDASPSIDACEPVSEVVRFVLAPPSVEGDLIEFQTAEDGSAHLASLEGSYTLVEVGQQPCLVASTDTDTNGDLALSADREVIVQVFHCG